MFTNTNNQEDYSQFVKNEANHIWEASLRSAIKGMPYWDSTYKISETAIKNCVEYVTNKESNDFLKRNGFERGIPLRTIGYWSDLKQELTEIIKQQK